MYVSVYAFSFYHNKATCTLSMFKTKHYLFFPVKGKDNLKINRDKITIENVNSK